MGLAKAFEGLFLSSATPLFMRKGMSALVTPAIGYRLPKCLPISPSPQVPGAIQLLLIELMIIFIFALLLSKLFPVISMTKALT